ncbi:MAG TPA: alanine--glyoxylate aminotransferase family protein [Bryobacteraceae bacterium]|nr:alanine--glyoxylate aminotransferase family protein [Bryobacteraceae bacterium]
MHIRKQRLLTPGPTALYPKALHAMMESDIHHRTEDFRRLYRQVLSDLKELMGTSGDVLCMVASGTGAMEASVTNFFSKEDRVIVCSAGKFGERWVDLAKAFGLDAIVLNAEYGSAVPVDAVERALAENPEVRGVFVQASETSTGAAHDVRSMGLAIRKTEAIFVIDAITGLGTMPLDIDGWGLDVVISGSQKSFMVPPGLAWLSISQKAWARYERADLPRLYFDLKLEKKNAEKGESAWTPAIPLLLALSESLKYIKSVGMDKLVENAQSLAKAMRAAAVELGLELFAPDAPSSSVTSIRAPQGISSTAIVKEFRTRFDSIISDGQGSMKGAMFRIAHLGYYDFPDLFALVAELELILAGLGHPVEFGRGVAAVQQVYAEIAGLKQPSLQSV